MYIYILSRDTRYLSHSMHKRPVWTLYLAFCASHAWFEASLYAICRILCWPDLVERQSVRYLSHSMLAMPDWMPVCTLFVAFRGCNIIEQLTELN